MRNRIALMMITGATFFSLCSFTGENETETSVSSLLEELGIVTEVDAAALEAKYPSVNVALRSATNGTDVEIKFNNPAAHNYNLDMFDYEGNLVASYNNIIRGNQVLPSNLFSRGSYTYKLTGEGNVYAGKFFYQ